MAERHAETRRDRNYKVSKISNFHDMSKKRSGLIHTIRRLNIAEAICLRQKGRRDVTRIPLLTWLDSLGNASCPHGLKHAKLSPVSNSSPPPLPADWQPQCRCSTLPEWRTRLGYAGGMGRWRELRGKSQKKKGEGRGEERGQSGDEGARRRADLWEQVRAKAHVWH